MKHILAMILVLALLLGAVPAFAEVDYAADYEAALTLAHNDLTNIKSLETAVDMLQQLGGYGFAKNYVRYLRAVMDVQASDPDLPLIKGLFETFGRDENFVKDLEERGFPSCDRLIGYVDARQMEARDEIDAAYETYSANSVLDAADRAYEMYIRKASATPTPVPESTPEPPENTPAPAAGSDASHTYKVGNQTRFTAALIMEEHDELCDQLFHDAANWTEETAPQHIDDFPLMPDFIEQMDLDAKDEDFILTKENGILVWRTHVGKVLEALLGPWTHMDYGYQIGGGSYNFVEDYNDQDEDTSLLLFDENRSIEDIDALKCFLFSNFGNQSYFVLVHRWLMGENAVSTKWTEFSVSDYLSQYVVSWMIITEEHGASLSYYMQIKIWEAEKINLVMEYDMVTGDIRLFETYLP